MQLSWFAQQSPSAVNLQLANSRLRVDHLPLQIAFINKITINDSQPPDACTRQQACGSCSSSTTPNERDVTVPQPLLPFWTNPGEEHLPGVTLRMRNGG